MKEQTRIVPITLDSSHQRGEALSNRLEIVRVIPYDSHKPCRSGKEMER